MKEYLSPQAETPNLRNFTNRRVIHNNSSTEFYEQLEAVKAEDYHELGKIKNLVLLKLDHEPGLILFVIG